MWSDKDGYNLYNMKAQFYGADGNLLGGQRSLDGIGMDSAAQLADGNIVLAWLSAIPSSRSTTRSSRLRISNRQSRRH
ncbi:MAG: hypothetical protein EOP84_31355 [Verrucomicrobiaceae bacterium]|nr:MAG: hypothetical protein EOP84_31355 [Verrucomicrobiaceae bacterium]